MLKKALLFTILTLTLVSISLASEIDGKWKANVEARGRSMEYIFDFQTDGDELTGTITTPSGKDPIQNGRVIGNRVTFDTEFNGETISNEGTVTGETFFIYFGPWEMEMLCQRVTEETEKAQPEAKEAKTGDTGINGIWLGSVPGMDGGEMELTFNFKVEDNKLSGTIESMMGLISIINPKVNGDEFSFDIDLQGMVISHKCKLDGETITMQYTGMNGEEEMTLTRK